MERRPIGGRLSVGSGFGFGTVRRAVPGELRTNATTGFAFNNSGPFWTFTNRVQGGSGQAARHHG